MYTYRHMYIYIYICMYVCMYVCMCVYIYIYTYNIHIHISTHNAHAFGLQSSAPRVGLETDYEPRRQCHRKVKSLRGL